MDWNLFRYVINTNLQIKHKIYSISVIDNTIDSLVTIINKAQEQAIPVKLSQEVKTKLPEHILQLIRNRNTLKRKLKKLN